MTASVFGDIHWRFSPGDQSVRCGTQDVCFSGKKVSIKVSNKAYTRYDIKLTYTLSMGKPILCYILEVDNTMVNERLERQLRFPCHLQ